MLHFIFSSSTTILLEGENRNKGIQPFQEILGNSGPPSKCWLEKWHQQPQIPRSFDSKIPEKTQKNRMVRHLPFNVTCIVYCQPRTAIRLNWTQSGHKWARQCSNSIWSEYNVYDEFLFLFFDINPYFHYILHFFSFMRKQNEINSAKKCA